MPSRASAVITRIPRIAVTGAGGQVGWELLRSLSVLGDVRALTREECNLARPEALGGILRRIEPDVIVNAAAYTAVDLAEAEPDAARRVNDEAVGVLGTIARSCGALLLHYSTDYVFDGTKPGAYAESDATSPINVYGASKLGGEAALQASGCDHLVLRTSWVYARRGKNFLLTVLRLARERSELRIVDDQRGAPTWARTIADATAHIALQALRERLQGRFESSILNLTASGSTSWHGFATTIVEQAVALGLLDAAKTPRIVPITSAEYPTPAKRPSNSVLSLQALAERYGIVPPRWDSAVALCMDEMRG